MALASAALGTPFSDSQKPSKTSHQSISQLRLTKKVTVKKSKKVDFYSRNPGAKELSEEWSTNTTDKWAALE